MATQAEILDEVSKLLKEGKVQEADDLAQKTAADVRAADAKDSGATPPPPPKRDPATIAHALFAALAQRLGNPPGLVALLDELAQALPLK